VIDRVNFSSLHFDLRDFENEGEFQVSYVPATPHDEQIAVEGCCHGELDAIYEHVSGLETKHNYKIDLLLICGDFQAIRNQQDLECMSVPDKFRQLGGFNE